MQINLFTAVCVIPGRQKQASRLAVIEDLVVKNVSIRGLFARRLGRGKGEIEDVLKRALVAYSSARGLWVNGETGGRIVLEGHDICSFSAPSFVGSLARAVR